MHITYCVCFYGVFSAVFKEIKSTHFWILNKFSRKFQHTFWDLEIFLKIFKYTHISSIQHVVYVSMEFSTVFKEVKTTQIFSIIFETHTLHAYYPYYMLLYYLALSFRKENNNTLLDTTKILMKISTHILGLKIFF